MDAHEYEKNVNLHIERCKNDYTLSLSVGWTFFSLRMSLTSDKCIHLMQHSLLSPPQCEHLNSLFRQHTALKETKRELVFVCSYDERGWLLSSASISMCAKICGSRCAHWIFIPEHPFLLMRIRLNNRNSSAQINKFSSLSFADVWNVQSYKKVLVK